MKFPSGCADASGGREQEADGDQNEQAFHEASLLKVDVHRTEKCGLSASAAAGPRPRVVAQAARDHRAVEELGAVAGAEAQGELE